jgi:competence CoiA-like predicted nuclease
MRPYSNQNLLSANCSDRRVTLGIEALEELRGLSDARALTCPGCGAPVVLHAGTVRAHHFAHLPGAVCSLPQTEPETPEHRAGKLLLVRWLRACLPNAEAVIEAPIAETGQRADVLAVVPR